LRTRIALAAVTTATLFSSTATVTVDAAVDVTRTAPATALHADHSPLVTLTAIPVSTGLIAPAVSTTTTSAPGEPSLRVVRDIAHYEATEVPAYPAVTLQLREATPPPPPPTDATSTTTPTWACIRYYESTDRYNTPTAPDGAYQIIESTWQGMGFSGQAYEYPPAVQDAAALELYNARGWEPWSTRFDCGL